jgi:tRNA threonylcarbamoyladenosine biosynthesis protein TsaB
LDEERRLSRFLAIETSAAVGSVALAAGEGLFEGHIATSREQTTRVLPIVAELLAGAGIGLRALDAVVFGRGPGSFTGLRIATATAQGLALAERAWRETGTERALVCIDARMGEVYWACFAVRDGRAQPAGAEHISGPDAVQRPDWDGWTAIGDGFAAYAEELRPLTRTARAVITDQTALARDLLPQAAADFAAGLVIAPAAARPTYLRDDTAWRRSAPVPQS